MVWAPLSKILATHMVKTLHFGLDFESNLAQREVEAKYSFRSNCTCMIGGLGPLNSDSIIVQ